MYLTTLEIKHLAESAGFVISESNLPEEDWDEEHLIQKCPDKGIMNDDGIIEHFRYVAVCDGCDPGECFPLGDPLVKESTQYDRA